MPAALTSLPAPPDGFFYPPAMGVVMLPLALIPFGTARTVLLLACVGVMVFAVWALFSLARPSTRWPVRTAVAGLVLVTACLRWSWTPVQMAPLTAGLLVAALWGLHRGKPWVTFVATAIALALKFTLGLPFVILLLLHRRYSMIVSALATYALLTAIGFLRVGGFAAADAYRTGSLQLERRGTVNTPDFWEVVSIPRLDWTYLFTGLIHDFTSARVLALGLGMAAGLLICLACIRIEQPVSLDASCRVAMAASCLGLLVVYHHHYDLAVLVGPLLLIWLLSRERQLYMSYRTTWTLVPVVVLMTFLPVDAFTSHVRSTIGDRGAGLVNVAFPIATTLAFVGSLIVLLRSTGDIADWKAWVASRKRLRPRRATSQLPS